jgi:pimeloyl-ACP methyl ester carboxylesterase
LPEAHYVGHSLGTIVCQAIAADQPSAVDRWCLARSPSRPRRRGRAQARADPPAAKDGGIADQIGPTLSGGDVGDAPAAVAFVRESLMRQNPEGYARPARRWPRPPSMRGSSRRRPPRHRRRRYGQSGQRPRARRPHRWQSVTVDRGGHWLTTRAGESN